MPLLTLAAALLIQVSLQEPRAVASGPQELLDSLALEQAGRQFSVRDVLQAQRKWDRSLPDQIERDAGYARLYLASPKFLDLLRQFSIRLALDSARVPAAGREALLAEAAAYAADRGLRLPAEAVLVAHGMEIDWRARLIALQPASFSTMQLRQHMLSSVPEFFGDLELTWIRLPLVDLATGRAFSQQQRQEVHARLDGIANAVQKGSLGWAEAIEEHTESPRDRRLKGRVGIVQRTQTGLYEEPLLREVFRDLGYKRTEGPVLRGPILTSAWAYLVRIESVQTRGVVDLEQVRPRVARSVREQMLQQKLSELMEGLQRTVHAPVLPAG